jgi:L-malate glycosyltransferase
MKKILVITNALPSKSFPFSAKFVLNIAEGLKEKEFEPIIVGIKTKKTNILGTTFKYIYLLLKFFPNLFKNYDIVHVHFFFPTIILGYLYKVFHPKVVLVSTFHGSDISFNINSWLSQVIFKAISKKINTKISVSNYLSFVVKKKLDYNPEKIISAGIDNKVFFQKKSKKEYDFLFVGALSKIKGLDFFLKALESLETSCSIRIIGTGNLKREVLDFIKRTHHTTFYSTHLSQKDLCNEYNKSRFLILPSRSEGFGLVVSESMFCGTPVVGSNIGGIPEQIVDGYNGYLFNLNNESGLKIKMNQCLNKTNIEYKKMSENAKNSNRHHEMGVVIQRHLDIYSSGEGLTN